LLVADPQLVGEKDELQFLGIFSRWDSDIYLQRTYSLALKHVKPHVVVFLGDLFDEGSTAEEEEYQRYLARFRKIFDLPRRGDPSEVVSLLRNNSNNLYFYYGNYCSTNEIRCFLSNLSESFRSTYLYPGITTSEGSNGNLSLTFH
jgi:hypothetical protein